MTTPEQLGAARTEIMERGWCQGRTVAADGRVCAVGALMMVTGFAGIKTMPEADSYLVQAARQLGYKPSPAHIPIDASSPTIVAFNDVEGMTAGDVLAIFDEAILLAKEASA